MKERVSKSLIAATFCVQHALFFNKALFNQSPCVRVKTWPKLWVEIEMLIAYT